jgi:hypothetical protein
MTTARPAVFSRHSLFLHGLVIGTLIAAQSVNAAARPAPEDYLFGTWELVPQLSVYINSKPPKSQTRIYRQHGDEVDATIVTVTANGTEQRSTYIAPYDGQPHPVTGLANAETAAFTRLNPWTSLGEFYHAGLVASTSERTISNTGDEMTITVRVDGNVTMKAVYEKTQGPE